MARKFSNEDLKRWKREINPAPMFASRMRISRENAEWVGNCPKQYHEARVGHPDKTPSFKVYKMDDGVWGFKCFGCGASGNVFQFVQKMDGVPFVKAVETVLIEAGEKGWEEGVEQDDADVPQEKDPEHFDTFRMKDYRQAIDNLEKSYPGQEWLAARGITMATAHKFHLGFIQSAAAVTNKNEWLNDGWIAIPTLSATDPEVITAIKYRSLVAKHKKIKGKQNSGILRASDTSTTLYNLQAVDPKNDLWIAEGEPDVWALAQAGCIAVGFPSASYKCSDTECEALSSTPRRFLAGDNDAAGKKMMADLQARLTGDTYVIEWPNKRKDANDVLTNECGNDPEKFKALVERLKAQAIQTEAEAVLKSAADIEPERIKWMWFEKIPFGKVTLFAGNPDNGKSLAATSVAAIVSAGKTFSGEHFNCKPADVLMMIGEDDLADTVVPRLMAAEADLARVHFFEGVIPVKEEQREVRLDRDIPALRKQIKTSLKTDRPIKLLIIDPVSNYLGDVSMMAEQEVRSILIPLKRLAEEFEIAVILVMHLNKKNDLEAISRVGGAMAFTGVARSSWLFQRDVKEEEHDAGDGEEHIDEKKSDTFSMLRIKNNLISAAHAGLSYSVEVRNVGPGKDGQDIYAPRICWGGVVEGSADDALQARGRHSEPSEPKTMGRPNNEFQEATKWLEEVLQPGKGLPVKDLHERATLAGISNMTLNRAYRKLPGRVEAYLSGTGKNRKYYWRRDPIFAGAEDDGLPSVNIE